MYLKDIIIENVGPIGRLDVELGFDESQNPKPVIFVGENGSGKTIVLSHIVDALVEFAKQSFRDVMHSSQSLPNPYFKITGVTNVKMKSSYGIAFLNFVDSETFGKNNFYFDKAGEIDYTLCFQKTNQKLPFSSFDVKGNVKLVTHDQKYFEDVFVKESYLYYPTYRYEYPHWFNKSSQNQEFIHESPRFSGVLNKPITIYSCLTENRKWLLDVILDSKIDLNGVVNLLNAVQGRETVRGLQGLVYVNLIANIQQLFSSILGRQVALGLNLRNQGSRINIIDSTTGAILVPSLDHLSTGQTILINMFLSIVRYVEHGNINRSLTLNNIKGIVVIDEIEQHLHAVLQREVLPHLIKLFPKVQFIITSHSPLFLLGMQECFGENGFDLYEMPSGIKINTERFSEFQKSYEYYKQTKQFEFDVRVALNSIQVNEKKFILYTEGPSDVIHLNTAWKKLHSNQEMPFDIISLDCASKLRMFLVAYSERQIDKTAIGLFDFDETGLKEIKEINAKTEIEECIYKLNNKDAYAIRIPCNEVNMIRIKNCPIEFLYKRELLDRYSMLEKISFTEFNGRYKPTSPDESKIWSESKELFLYKLTEQSNSKMSFANQINEDSGLTKEDFEGFKALFDKILRIVEPSKIVEP